MAEIKALILSLDDDIAVLSRWLSQQGIQHWVTEESGRQVVYVKDDQDADSVKQYYQRFKQGDLAAAQTAPPAYSSSRLPWRQIIFRVPVTLLTIILSVLGALVFFADNNGQLLHWFTFQNFIYGTNGVYFQSVNSSLQNGQYWRLITPTFLHFGLLHIAFNATWMWYFGHRIELLQGRKQLLLLVVATALAANIAQYIMVPNSIFGGLSGVDAGLVGYVWVWSLLNKGQDFAVPGSLIYMMLAYLVIAATGVISLFGGSDIANAAHFGGLFSGMIVALMSRVLAVGYRSP